MLMYAKVRRMYFREQLSISEISRQTSLSRNTLKKWLEVAEGSEPKYKRSKLVVKLTPFVARLTEALQADSFRIKRDRRTALMLFQTIQKEGFTGCYARVTEFVRHWRNAKLDVGKSVYVPLKFANGEAFQFDWSEEWLVIGGIHRKVLASHTKLCASRAFMVSGYPAQSHEMLFDAHTRAFTAFGGIPKRGIYDNMKTAVNTVGKGKLRVVNTRFFAMTAHYLFDADFCNVASGWEKGVVEKNVQDARRRIWMDAKAEVFSDFDELNVWLEAKCRALWLTTMHPDYEHITLMDALEQERDTLMPMPMPFDGYIEVTARVSSTCLVSVQRNRYSVPCHLANHKITIHLYPERIEAYADNQMVAQHPRQHLRDQTCYDWQHYIAVVDRKPGALRNGAPFLEMPLPFLKLQAALRRRERQDGDRVMATVLASVPVYGLEAVLVAVELVLESGVASVEQVINVLTRLKQEPRPAAVETHLMLREEPRADTARYDQLKVVAHV
jgi:transposase